MTQVGQKLLIGALSFSQVEVNVTKSEYKIIHYNTVEVHNIYNNSQSEKKSLKTWIKKKRPQPRFSG